MATFIQHLLQLALSPSRGWEDVSARMTSPARLVSAGMMPVVWAAAAAWLLQPLYSGSDVGWGGAVVMAMATVASYVVTYYVLGQLFQTFAGKLTDTGEPSAHKFVTVEAYVLGLLAACQTLVNALPWRMELLYILPAGVSLVLWKAERYLGIKEENTVKYYAYGCCLLVIPPYLIQGFFKLLI